METVLELTRSQLIEAQKKYHKEMVEHPEDFMPTEELDCSDEQAASVVDHLLALVEYPKNESDTGK